MVLISLGSTQNFDEPFKNTNTDAGSIALAVLDGYFAYKGWYVNQHYPLFHFQTTHRYIIMLNF